jgi:plastocyanin
MAMNKFVTHEPTVVPSVLLLVVLVATTPSNVFASFANSSGAFNADITFVGSSSNITSETTTTGQSDVQITPVVAVITISEGKDGKIVYEPYSTTIMKGDEILIANNSTSPHSVTNGDGPTDPLSGKLFDTGMINPRTFIEYVASNLQPGKYAYYSTSDPSVKGEIVVVAGNQQ